MDVVIRNSIAKVKQGCPNKGENNDWRKVKVINNKIISRRLFSQLAKEEEKALSKIFGICEEYILDNCPYRRPEFILFWDHKNAFTNSYSRHYFFWSSIPDVSFSCFPEDLETEIKHHCTKKISPEKLQQFWEKAAGSFFKTFIYDFLQKGPIKNPFSFRTRFSTRRYPVEIKTSGKTTRMVEASAWAWGGEFFRGGPIPWSSAWRWNPWVYMKEKPFLYKKKFISRKHFIFCGWEYKNGVAIPLFEWRKEKSKGTVKKYQWHYLHKEEERNRSVEKRKWKKEALEELFPKGERKCVITG